MTGRTVSLVERGMYGEFAHLCPQILVTVEADILFCIHKEVFVLAAVGIMAVCTFSIPDSTMHLCAHYPFPQFLVTGITEFIYVIPHKPPVLACMDIVTGCAIALVEGAMDRGGLKLLSEGFVAGIAEFRLAALEVDLCKGGCGVPERQHHQQ